MANEATKGGRLAGLKGRRTLYELAMVHPDGRRLLVAYTSRRGRAGLWCAVTDDRRRTRVVALAGTDQIRFMTTAALGATMGGWMISYTGRTERQAIVEGELPYVGDLEG